MTEESQEYIEAEWRDIKSVPKDGSKILMADNVNVFIGIWDKHYDYDNGGLRFYGAMEFNPTHWMPLPKPMVEPSS